jgi:hypothetical protein
VSNPTDESQRKAARTLLEQERIEMAREHYRTRAERRTRGTSRSSLTHYSYQGMAFSGAQVLRNKQILAGVNFA